MKKYIHFAVFLFSTMCAFSQDTLFHSKQDVKMQQDSIYFTNILNSEGFFQQLFVSVTVQNEVYTGKVILGAMDFQSIVRNYLKKPPRDSSYSFAFNLLINNDTLRAPKYIFDISNKLYYLESYRLKSIPMVDVLTAKGQDEFLAHFFEPPYYKNKAFLKRREELLWKTPTNLEWLEFQNAIINQLIEWRMYCRSLHRAEGRLQCDKDFEPPPSQRK